MPVRRQPDDLRLAQGSIARQLKVPNGCDEPVRPDEKDHLSARGPKRRGDFLGRCRDRVRGCWLLASSLGILSQSPFGNGTLRGVPGQRMWSHPGQFDREQEAPRPVAGRPGDRNRGSRLAVIRSRREVAGRHSRSVSGQGAIRLAWPSVSPFLLRRLSLLAIWDSARREGQGATRRDVGRHDRPAATSPLDLQRSVPQADRPRSGGFGDSADDDGQVPPDQSWSVPGRAEASTHHD